MRTAAVVLHAQPAGNAVGAQQHRLGSTQYLALGIRRQLLCVADAHGYLAGCQQAGHQQVVGAAHHQHHVWRFGAQAAQQRWQQGELHFVGQADAKHLAAGGRIEGRGTTDGSRDRIQCRR